MAPTGVPVPYRHRRIQVALIPEVDAALRELSEVSGIPASTWLSRQLLPALVPLLGALSAALRSAKDQPKDAALIMGEALASAVRDANSAQLELLSLVRGGRRP